MYNTKYTYSTYYAQIQIQITPDFSITDQVLSDCMNSISADWDFKAQGSISKAHYFLTDGYRHCQLGLQA